MISKYPPILIKEISFCHKTMKTKQPKPHFLKKLKSFSYWYFKNKAIKLKRERF
ncbi:hypothetical protein HMPREF1409_00175 [Helicobacter pylori GAM246Ai]|nr:hypothetical protein HMPREF1409_00175 [Helicobacter pylori GAM246Ai]